MPKSHHPSRSLVVPTIGIVALALAFFVTFTVSASDKFYASLAYVVDSVASQGKTDVDGSNEQPMSQFDITGPAGSGAFGTSVTVLPNGNFVVTDPNYDAPGPVTDVGAVYLYSPSGGLISVISGSQAMDQIGVGGVTVLANGNYVFTSYLWDNGVFADTGAVTWCGATTGCAGAVSTSNSLVGQLAGDLVGVGGFAPGIRALSNGNYVVASPFWNNFSPSTPTAGAVTFCSGTTGCSGLVTSSNSLYGPNSGDQIGYDGVTELTNGNYVVASSKWNSGDVGAVTWCNGTTGRTGSVTGSNSLTGNSFDDQVGGGGVTALTNGNYVVRTPTWASSDIGAVTWCNGASGCSGQVSFSNSLIGATANDMVGFVTALTNGNYIVSASSWSRPGVGAGVGAVTWCNGTTGTTGSITPANSLVGSAVGNSVGLFSTALTNGNYVVASPYWDGTAANAGAVTWCSGTTGCSGDVSSGNSLVGSTADDNIGLGSGANVKALANGNYVVGSPNWNGLAADVGAVTWCNGTTGRTGVVSAANSLLGSTASDNVGLITPLTNGNYVVSSSNWDGPAANIGAATWCDGSVGRTGVVSAGNSLVGSTIGDAIGNRVSALSNGNYVVASPSWDGSASDVGAATLCDGASGTVAVVSAANSLVGSIASDLVANQIVIPLTNANFVVRSSGFDNPTGPGSTMR